MVYLGWPMFLVPFQSLLCEPLLYWAGGDFLWMPEPTHLPEGQAGGGSSPPLKTEWRWCMIPKVPHPSVIRAWVCSMHSLTRPQWTGAPAPHHRSRLHNPVHWLPSLYVPVSLPHVSTSVSRTPSKIISIHSNPCVRVFSWEKPT